MKLPALGMGTWHMGEDARRRAAEVAALRLGLDLGMRLIDTAEMYGDGGAEEVVGEAMRGRRDEVFVVSKFYPHNASKAKLGRACEASLRRLGTDRIDLYLLHWPGSVPLEETVDALEALVAAGRIRGWGVSNFDVEDMRELSRVPRGQHAAANQVLYNLGSRGIEYDLLPLCAQGRVDVMAYCPLGKGPLVQHPALRAQAGRLGVSPAQVALAWLLGRGVCAIPKAARLEHVKANAASVRLLLDEEAVSALDVAFPPPSRRQPFEVI